MKTTGQPQSQRSAGRRVDTLDVVLLVLTVLVLAATAAGIVIGFPQALQIVAAQASTATAVAADAPAAERHAAAGEDEEENNEPFFADDIRREGVRYASTPALDGGSEPLDSTRR